MTLRQIFLATTVLAALGGGYAQAQQSAVSNQRTAQDQTEGQGTQIFVSSAGVRQIQQALTQKGYSTGNVDGRWNTQTAAAQLPAGAEHGADRHAHHPARLWSRSRAGHHLRQ